MRVFVYEAICAGDLPDARASDSLLREGREMLTSILTDLEAIQEIRESVTIVDARLAREIAPGPRVRVSLAEGNGDGSLFDELARSAAGCLIIAPESSGLLLDRSRRVLELGGRLFGCTPRGIALAGDKLRLARHLTRHGVPTPPLVEVDLGAISPAPSPGRSAGGSQRFPAVLKPRHGAGSQFTYRIDRADALPDILDLARREGAPPAMVLGPWVAGVAASASFILGDGPPWALEPGFQEISGDGRCRYLGSRIPLTPPALGARAVSLARRALEAVPGLRGFVGVDLVLGEPTRSREPEGIDDAVIEINPRLTSSYVALRRDRASGGIVRRWLEPLLGETWR